MQAANIFSLEAACHRFVEAVDLCSVKAAYRGFVEVAYLYSVETEYHRSGNGRLLLFCSGCKYLFYASC
jgi:hypothetical protein